MRPRITRNVPFRTSTTMISEKLAGNTYNILVYEKDKVKPKYRATKFAMWFYNKAGVNPYTYLRKQHKFIERFLPHNEEQFEALKKFYKNKRVSRKKLNPDKHNERVQKYNELLEVLYGTKRKPPVGTEALRVA